MSFKNSVSFKDNVTIGLLLNIISKTVCTTLLIKIEKMSAQYSKKTQNANAFCISFVKNVEVKNKEKCRSQLFK